MPWSSRRGSARTGRQRPVEPRRWPTLAYRQIQDLLVRLDIRPGAPINEEDLCLRLGLGRTPVREALKRLEHERLVVAYPRRGTFATEINVTDLTHIFEVRAVIEPAAAASAARHATPADRAVFQALAGRAGRRDRSWAASRAS